ncbi:uncharacterized protein DDB_G0287625-like isoform X2 [Condylostylus longicornis]|nr:uncharacterized protein DDB_G0287625-like isoform X2 [Condylostylus longicornis]
MSEERHTNMNSDDEDDLESLRLAALKSINLKKDCSPSKTQVKFHEISNKKVHIQMDTGICVGQDVYTKIPQMSQQQNPLSMQPFRVNPDLDGVHQTQYCPQSQRYPANHISHLNVYIPQVSQYISAPHSRPIIHANAPMANNVPRPPGPVRLWLPPQEQTHNGNAYSSNKEMATYTPKPIIKDTLTTDVQLSPRSLAFVAQNNGILARRKIEADLSPKKHYRRSKSPSYRRISRSPSSLYRQSPPRWSSITPPPHSTRQRFSKSKSKSPSRRSRSKPFQYNYKRSRSRSSSGSGHTRHVNERKRRSFSRNSDYRPLSPGHHNRHSRSPTKVGNVSKRNKSRTPLQRRYSPISNLSHRRLSRSRSPRRNHFEMRRSRSPQAGRRRVSPGINLNKRSQRRMIERKSPGRSKRKSPVGKDNNRRDSPLQSNNYNRRKPRKSLSPQLKKRSRTPKSPINLLNKKFVRKSRDRQVNTTILNSQTHYASTNIRKRSPIVNILKNKTNDGYNSTNNNNNSNNNNNKSNSSSISHSIHNSNGNFNLRNKVEQDFQKSKSPSDRKRRSRSKTEDKIGRRDEFKKENETAYNRDYEKKSNQKSTEEQFNKMNTSAVKFKDAVEKQLPQSSKEIMLNKTEKSKTPPPSEDNFESLTPPIEKDMDDAKLIEEIDAMLGDNKSNKSNNSSDEEDDGIDLFASEESESENEGRFKSSNKTERNYNVQAVSFTKLKESSVTPSIRNLQDVVSDEKYEENQNRRDYFKKYSRNIKVESRRRGGDYFSSKRHSRSSSIDKNKFLDNNENTSKTKFKSSFQIKNEGSRILSKPSPKSNIRSTPERNVKKRSKDNNSSELKDRKPTLQNTNTPPHLLEQLRNNNSQSYGKSGQSHGQQKKEKVIRTSKLKSSTSRKSIHSRLGAMTNTFKSSTKSSWDMTSSYYDQV